MSEWLITAISKTRPEFKTKVMRIMISPEIQEWMSSVKARASPEMQETIDEIYPDLYTQFCDTLVLSLGACHEETNGTRDRSLGSDSFHDLYQNYDPYLDYILEQYDMYKN